MKISSSQIVFAGVFLLMCSTVVALEPDVLYSFSAGPRSPQGRLFLASDGKFYGTTAYGGNGYITNQAGVGTVFSVSTNGVAAMLAWFDGTNGVLPQAGLVQGTDGNFYGVTSGIYHNYVSNAATVFKMTPGGNITALAHLNTTNASELLLGRDGNFYGTTILGGSNNAGMLYRFTTNGLFTTLVHFPRGPDGFPLAGLVQGSDGNFYGTTTGGNLNSNVGGTVFKMTIQGALTTLARFHITNGSFPQGTLIEGSDGNFYGTTFWGGQYNGGTVFKMTPAGALTTLISFAAGYAPPNGSSPKAGLVQALDGNFYGTTSYGGVGNGGTVFQLQPSGTLLTLVSFTNVDGANPWTQMVIGPDGALYGTTTEGGLDGRGTVFRITTNGVFTSLLSFSDFNGAQPYAGLALGPDGNLYGTTSSGGLKAYGGTVFRISISGEFTSLAAFSGSNGWQPEAPLLLASDGNFYGTTSWGGSNGYGVGTVFCVNSSGIIRTIASFDYFGTNGANPAAGLVLGANGNFYGTCSKGGNYNFGTVFRCSTNGVLTGLVSFNNTNGANPQATLLLAPDGNFYGTTVDGGDYGFGTVFRMTPDGMLTKLVSFDNNGGHPYAGLILGPDGYLYGACMSTLFKMNLGGVLTTLASFNSSTGGNCRGGLLLGDDGNFYGTTYGVSSDFGGTVFQLTTNGTLTVVATFRGTNGLAAFGPLARGPDGNLYGVTVSGGPGGLGTVYRLPISKFTSVSKQTGGNVLLSAVGLPGDTYRLWASSSPLGSWSLLTTNNFDTIGNASYTDWSALTNPSRFYRLSVP